MIDWYDTVPVHLHVAPVDFRKSINGLSVIIEETMGLSPFERGIFVFCNRRRDKLKTLYWDHTGFALWYKRLENDRFKWPKHQTASTLTVNHEQWDWLLRGLNFLEIKPHQARTFSAVN